MGATSGFLKEIFPLLQSRGNADNTLQSQGATQYNGGFPATKAGYFGVLPPELILQILTSLPPSSAASLALASHTLLRILGTRHFVCLGPDSLTMGARDPVTVEDRAIFLRGLIRDLPAGSSFYCYHCHKIHLLFPKKRKVVCMEIKSVKELRTPNHERIFNRVNESSCNKGRSLYNVDPLSTIDTFKVYHRRFFFEHVQMAMQLHQHDSRHLLKGYLSHLSLTKAQVRNMSLSGDHMGFHFFEPRIVDNQMIVRAQTWIVMLSKDGVDVQQHLDLPAYLSATTICAHLNLRIWQENQLLQVVRCRLAHVQFHTPSPCVSCVGNIRCPLCPTEVQVDIKTLYSDECKMRSTTMLVITRWQLVGGGTSPYEEPWAYRLSRGCSPWHWLEGDPQSSIRHTFEGQRGTKFDSILDSRVAWKLVIRYSRKSVWTKTY